jgi:DNA polymerase III epsilon subunit-like protein
VLIIIAKVINDFLFSSYIKMIVVDIETSGLNPDKCGIWQIGAIDLMNPNNSFLGESRIDEDDLIEDDALVVTGKTRRELKDSLKKSQEQLLIDFFNWVEKVEIKNLLCQNPQFDISFIRKKAERYGLSLPFYHRVFDLHSISQLRYFQLKKEFLIKDGHSNMNLSECLRFCGIEDTRIMVHGSKIIREGDFHSALEDCKLEAECFYRLVYGKCLLEGYNKFKLPEYLKQNDNL